MGSYRGCRVYKKVYRVFLQGLRGGFRTFGLLSRTPRDEQDKAEKRPSYPHTGNPLG